MSMRSCELAIDGGIVPLRLLRPISKLFMFLVNNVDGMVPSTEFPNKDKEEK